MALPVVAVINGYRDRAKVVTSAGIIMIAVFAAFILVPDPTTKSFGFSLALGVLIDAFVIRMTLVPAAMAIFGRSAWWLPAGISRLVPNLGIEGTNVPAPISAAVHIAHSDPKPQHPTSLVNRRRHPHD